MQSVVMMVVVMGKMALLVVVVHIGEIEGKVFKMLS